MSNDDEKLIEFFEKQFDRVNSWLLFAEAKNGTLLAINIAVIGCVIDKSEFKETTYFILILICISVFLCLLSFKPVKKYSKKLGNNKANKNLVFYYDIGSFETKEEYADAVLNKYFPSITNVDSYIMDLAEEILINSRITIRKYTLFKSAMMIDLVTIVVVLVSILIA